MIMEIARGAEAIISREGDTILKERISKPYRIPEIDTTLRRSRMRREAKVIERLGETGVLVPAVMSADESSMTLKMEFVDGEKVRDVMSKDPEYYGAALGSILARMHRAGIAHGDPTTSNFISSQRGVVVIDFGLSFFTKKNEDFAVDIHLLRQVFEGTHTDCYGTAYRAARDAYTNEWAAGETVLEWLDSKVEKRGRHKRK